ncbi:hypothetical protein HQ563_05950 [bacterium]|nr:hypothetical protein [bacterium]
MKAKRTRLQRLQEALTVSMALIVSAMLFVAATSTQSQAEDGSIFFQSGFDSETLDPGLTIVRENPSFYSLTERPGFFRGFLSRS